MQKKTQVPARAWLTFFKLLDRPAFRPKNSLNWLLILALLAGLFLWGGFLPEPKSLLARPGAVDLEYQYYFNRGDWHFDRLFGLPKHKLAESGVFYPSGMLIHTLESPWERLFYYQLDLTLHLALFCLILAGAALFLVPKGMSPSAGLVIYGLLPIAVIWLLRIPHFILILGDATFIRQLPWLLLLVSGGAVFGGSRFWPLPNLALLYLIAAAGSSLLILPALLFSGFIFYKKNRQPLVLTALLCLAGTVPALVLWWPGLSYYLSASTWVDLGLVRPAGFVFDVLDFASGLTFVALVSAGMYLHPKNIPATKLAAALFLAGGLAYVLELELFVTGAAVCALLFGCLYQFGRRRLWGYRITIAGLVPVFAALFFVPPLLLPSVSAATNFSWQNQTDITGLYGTGPIFGQAQPVKPCVLATQKWQQLPIARPAEKRTLASRLLTPGKASNDLKAVDAALGWSFYPAAGYLYWDIWNAELGQRLPITGGRASLAPAVLYSYYTPNPLEPDIFFRRIYEPAVWQKLALNCAISDRNNKLLPDPDKWQAKLSGNLSLSFRKPDPENSNTGASRLYYFGRSSTARGLKLPAIRDSIRKQAPVCETKDGEDCPGTVSLFGFLDADIKRGTDQLTIKLKEKPEGILLLPVNYDNGWQIDGGSLVKVAGNFLGIAPQADKDEYTLVYKSRTIVRSVIAVLIIAVAGLGYLVFPGSRVRE